MGLRAVYVEKVVTTTGVGATDEDAHVVARVVAGDLDAFEVLVTRWQQVAYRTALALGAGAEAEDIVQEAFLKAFQNLAGFRSGCSFQPWLLQIVANETKNLRRSRHRRQRLEFRLTALFLSDGHIAGEDPCAAVLRDERERLLWKTLQELPDKYRLVLTCRYLLELSEAETAQVLGWRHGSVKSRTSRALAKLRALLIPVETGEVTIHA